MARIPTMLHRKALFVPLILVGLTAGASRAQTQTPVISLGMHYQQAHDRMAVAGFRAFRVIPPGSALYKRLFAFREDIPRKYPEAAGCASTGRSPCYFLFRRGPKEIVEITTFGEHADALIVRDAGGVTSQQAQALYSR